MAAMLEACLGWFHRHLRWSNSRRSWQERLAVLILIAGAGALIGFRHTLQPLAQVILWAALGVACAGLLRRGWLKLFGPVLFYDLLCTARRSRYLLLRWLYALLLMLLLFWVYAMWHLRYHGSLRASDMAEFASSFFYTFMTVQFLTIVVLAPAYTAGAIAEEKDRKTLEFLLATDLRNREIVLSKLVARIANLTFILLAGMPILSGLQFLGGVDPDLVVAGFAATGITMMSLACLSIYNSVLMRKPRDAITVTYLGGIAYLLLSLVGHFLVVLDPFRIGFSSWGIDWQGRTPWNWGLQFSVSDLAEWFANGNIILTLMRLSSGVRGGRVLDDTLPAVLRSYLLFHALVAGVCATWAVLRLRAVALKESYGRVRRPSGVRRMFGRPRVGGWPMIWKEVVAEPGLRLNWFGRIILIVLIVLSFLPLIFIVDFDTLSRGGPFSSGYDTFAQSMNYWVRTVGTLVACLTLLAVAVRGSSSISGERDRQTWDSLVATPLSGDAILFGKWVGCVASIHWAALWLGVIGFLGVITRGLHPMAALLLVAAWLVYAALGAGIGLWHSMHRRTTLRATLWTMCTCLMISVGHWVVIGLGCYLPFAVLGMRDRSLELLFHLQFSQTPPAVLTYLAFNSRDIYWDHNFDYLLGFALFGVFSWAVAASFLGIVARHRFLKLTHRAVPPSHGPRRRRDRQSQSSSLILDALPADPTSRPGFQRPSDA
jgi:ABC-type transport system involved in multi-copper enzyme maturation permease subunit